MRVQASAAGAMISAPMSMPTSGECNMESFPMTALIGEGRGV